ncbi:hypothetical protein K503DRAFT_787569 [Rhizopogon vinicolor AM-OR11-026]|uniref:Uncharacterized protein n=1 Tax=Rhizopogon vinicolor AM-OR11-026 TaxID=1314800 RepID=A0A1B7MGZ6_9AGAM|nr:hypothetical protein K503DRAFT_787569 [Rhizopogon vinicolor AM-OR11-026]
MDDETDDGKWLADGNITDHVALNEVKVLDASGFVKERELPGAPPPNPHESISALCEGRANLLVNQTPDPNSPNPNQVPLRLGQGHRIAEIFTTATIAKLKKCRLPAQTLHQGDP